MLLEKGADVSYLCASSCAELTILKYNARNNANQLPLLVDKLL